MRGILSWIFNGAPNDYRYLVVKIEEEVVGLKVHTHVNMRASPSLTPREIYHMMREATEGLRERLEEAEAEK